MFQLLHLGDEQCRNPHLSQIIQRMRSYPHDPFVRMFAFRDNILYWHNFPPTGPDLLLVVTKHLRSTVLHELHDSPTVGHLRIFARITVCTAASTGLALNAFCDISTPAKLVKAVRNRRDVLPAIFSLLTSHQSLSFESV